VIPAEAFKSHRPHVAILNDAAWSIVQMQRGRHPQRVFPFRGRRVNGMNNTAWQRACRRAGLPDVRARFAPRIRDEAACRRVLDRVGTLTILRVANG